MVMQFDVLVLEDDPLLRMTIADVLRQDGFAVCEAGNSSVGLDMLRRMHPKLLVADIDLGPGKSGLDVGAEALEMLPELLIVYSTGRPASMAGYQLGLRERALPKPYQPEALTAMAHELIG